jgi:hypothetical protein
MKADWISALATAFLTFGSVVVFAQPGTSREVVIAHMEGTVVLDGLRLESSASPLPLKANSVVHTENGRVEIMLASGDALFLGENSSVRLSDNRGLNSSRFEMLAGSAVVITRGLGPAVLCEEEVQLSDSGVFRFDVRQIADQRFCRVRVYKGAAAAQLPSFIWVLTTGEMANLNRLCGDHTQRNEFNIEDINDLDRWSRQRAVSDARER